MPLSLIIPATATVQFMPLKATELQWHDDLPLGGGVLYTIPLLALYLRRNSMDTPVLLFSVRSISVCYADKISAPFNRQRTCKLVDSCYSLLNYRA